MPRETDIIARIGQLSGKPEYLADDAFYEDATRRIYTTDILVEDQHFKTGYFEPEAVGWKAAAVNISDIAAMGGALKYLLVSLALPESADMAWVERFYEGMLAICNRYGGEIAGGDTVGSAQLAVNVTAIGDLPAGYHLGRRNGAQPGDWIVATGKHGLSEVGLQALLAGEAGYEAAKSAHLKPFPRIEEGLILSNHYQRYALMDSSDGLADALVKIAAASGQKLVVKQDLIPVDREVEWYAEQHGKDALQIVLYGGEDFELVATVPELTPDVEALFSVLGRVEAPDGDAGAWLERPGGVKERLSLEKTYQHFGASR